MSKRTGTSRRSRSRGGFTLIEILVVVAVIAVLAALVAPNVFGHLGTAKDAAARTQMEMLGAALDAYRLDNGRYPSSARVWRRYEPSRTSIRAPGTGTVPICAEPFRWTRGATRTSS